MDIIKIIGIAFLAVLIIVILKQYRPEFAIYASIIAGVLILALASNTLSGIIDMIKNISNKTNINSEFLVILIKITGIAILTEFAVSICKDAGESAIASKVDVGGKIIINSKKITIKNVKIKKLIKGVQKLRKKFLILQMW